MKNHSSKKNKFFPKIFNNLNAEEESFKLHKFMEEKKQEIKTLNLNIEETNTVQKQIQEKYRQSIESNSTPSFFAICLKIFAKVFDLSKFAFFDPSIANQSAYHASSHLAIASKINSDTQTNIIALQYNAFKNADRLNTKKINKKNKNACKRFRRSLNKPEKLLFINEGILNKTIKELNSELSSKSPSILTLNGHFTLVEDVLNHPFVISEVSLKSIIDVYKKLLSSENRGLISSHNVIVKIDIFKALANKILLLNQFNNAVFADFCEMFRLSFDVPHLLIEAEQIIPIIQQINKKACSNNIFSSVKIYAETMGDLIKDTVHFKAKLIKINPKFNLHSTVKKMESNFIGSMKHLLARYPAKVKLIKYNAVFFLMERFENKPDAVPTLYQKYPDVFARTYNPLPLEKMIFNEALGTLIVHYDASSLEFLKQLQSTFPSLNSALFDLFDTLHLSLPEKVPFVINIHKNQEGFRNFFSLMEGRKPAEAIHGRYTPANLIHSARIDFFEENNIEQMFFTFMHEVVHHLRRNCKKDFNTNESITTDFAKEVISSVGSTFLNLLYKMMRNDHCPRLDGYWGYNSCPSYFFYRNHPEIFKQLWNGEPVNFGNYQQSYEEWFKRRSNIVTGQLHKPLSNVFSKTSSKVSASNIPTLTRIEVKAPTSTSKPTNIKKNSGTTYFGRATSTQATRAETNTIPTSFTPLSSSTATAFESTTSKSPNTVYETPVKNENSENSFSGYVNFGFFGIPALSGFFMGLIGFKMYDRYRRSP